MSGPGRRLLPDLVRVQCNRTRIDNMAIGERGAVFAIRLEFRDENLS